MKIALVHKRLDLKGGTERDFFKTAEGLRDLGHEVHLFCSEFGVEPPAGVKVHRVPVLPLGRTLRLWTFAWAAPRLIRRTACDVVVSFGRLLRQDVLRSGGGTHRGFLERVGRQGGLRRRLWQCLSVYHRSLLQIEKRQFQTNGCAKIIAVSEEVKADILSHYAVPADKITVVYNGVDPCRFNPARRATSRESIRRQWKIPADAPVVLFVGSGFRRKGLDRLLSLWQSPRLKDVFLLVVGDDSRINGYQSRANAIAPERIIFTGRRDDIESYYAAADVVALPAIQEAFGNVVMEALASGLPVLVSRNAGAAELLTGRLTQGIVDRPEDPRDLEEKLVFLLQHARDPHWPREARMIGEEHSWANHFKKLEAVLRAVHERRGVLLSSFSREERGSASVWVDRRLADSAFIDALADADRWFDCPQCEIIKSEYKTKVGRLTVKIVNEEHAVYVKRFNAFSARYRIATLFGPSRAYRSLRGAAILFAANIPTLRPLAAVEHRSWGALAKSFFISEEIAGGKTVDAYWRSHLRSLHGRPGMTERRRFLRCLAELFRSLHAQNIYHNDLKDANILAVSKNCGEAPTFFLLDLDGVRRYPRLSHRRRIKNLVQLHRTLGRYLSRTEKTYFLRTYLGKASADRAKKRRLVSKVLQQTRRLEVIKAQRAS